MKVVTPEISWHGRDPIYSVDSQFLEGDIHRIATCGADRSVRIWKVVEEEDKKVDVQHLATLTRHNKTVNVVRFSPNGEYLASGGDDAVILLWKLNEAAPHRPNIFQDDDVDVENKENWTVVKQLRSHLEDVYDLSWSADSKFLVSGSVDNSAIVWDIKKGSRITILPDHKAFVQGVAYDPLEQYVATMSSDRSCRIFSITSKNCLYNIHKGPGMTKPNGEKIKSSRLFHDDTMKSFFRRLTFTPDGLLLIVPAGMYLLENSDKEEKGNTIYIFSRHSFPKPIMHLPGHDKAAVAVRCSPVLYELRKIPKKGVSAEETLENSNKKPWQLYETCMALPYRMVFAVATEDTVILYDTQQPIPFASLSKMHYHTLSDISWSQDGRALIVSSTDGYCSIVTFEENEIGVPLENQLLRLNTVESIREMNLQSAKSKKKSKSKKAQAEKANSSFNSAENTSLSKQSESTHVSKENKESDKTPVSDNLQPPSTPKSESKSNTSAVHKSPFTENTKQPRRITVTTLTGADEDNEVKIIPPSSALSKTPTRHAVNEVKQSPSSSPLMKTPTRRMQVTTLETYTSGSPSKSDISTSQQNLPTVKEPEESLNLVLECDNTMDVDAEPIPEKTEDTPSKKNNNKKTPRRITVETLETI